MSADTKVFVVAEQSKILEAVENVNKHLDVFIRNRLDNFAKENGYTRWQAVNKGKGNHNISFSNGVKNTYVSFLADCPSFQIVFGCGDNKDRIVWCSQNSCDYKEIIEGNKIIFSWGCWALMKKLPKLFARHFTNSG